MLQVGFAQAVRSGINEIAPEVDLSRLDRGTYRLEVRLSDSDGRVLVSRSASLQLE